MDMIIEILKYKEKPLEKPQVNPKVNKMLKYFISLHVQDVIQKKAFTTTIIHKYLRLLAI